MPEASIALTDRELETLRWIAEGKTPRDIATILGDRPFAAANRCAALRKKLGATTMAQAVYRACRAGLLPVGG